MSKLEKKKKGSTVRECVKRAKKYISKYGACLLVFDVKGSGNFPNKTQLIKDLQKMMDDLNSKFSDYFPKNDLATRIRTERGFQILHGDCSWAGINNAEIIPEIIKYQKENYPDIPVYWGVAKDGWDKSEGIPWK